ncbi:MAG: hypothetical protein H6658_05575 [Ardenticatenaceae bacterium]|nr:hypothetical protein [Ardenticatenaceae bacterium]
MYARVVTALVMPGKMQEGVEIYENSIVLAMKEQPGFNRHDGTTLEELIA